MQSHYPKLIHMIPKHFKLSKNIPAGKLPEVARVHCRPVGLQLGVHHYVSPKEGNIIMSTKYLLILIHEERKNGQSCPREN